MTISRTLGVHPGARVGSAPGGWMDIRMDGWFAFVWRYEDGEVSRSQFSSDQRWFQFWIPFFQVLGPADTLAEECILLFVAPHHRRRRADCPYQAVGGQHARMLHRKEQCNALTRRPRDETTLHGGECTDFTNATWSVRPCVKCTLYCWQIRESAKFWL